MYTGVSTAAAGYMLREWIQHINVNIALYKMQCDFRDCTQKDSFKLYEKQGYY